ncbi:hypothetical protein EC968_008551 [Mortierella alpina]|nr:hypothetical protein EC968_008551 [Mortierella alpina]
MSSVHADTGAPAPTKAFTPDEHLNWATKYNGVEHVTFPKFVTQFKYYNSTDAHHAYCCLLDSGKIKQQRLKKIRKEYEQFKRNMDDLFWSKRLKDKNSAIVVNSASIIVQEAGLKQVDSNIRQHFNRHGPKLDDKNKRAAPVEVYEDDLFNQAEYSETDDYDDDDDDVALVNFKARTSDNRKRRHDALGDGCDSVGNERARMRLAQENADPSEERGSVESQEQDDVEELINMIKRIDHNSCCEWTVSDNKCIPCLAARYQQEAIAALRRKELKKSQPADYMILIGVFAPFNRTPLMTSVFGSHNLESIKQALELNLDMPDGNDVAVLSAVRLKMNRKEERALDELSSVKNRKLRNMYEHLIIHLPRREDPPDAEETLVTNFISPILRAFVQNTDAGLVTHFPNTDSKVQKQEGVVPDRPDFKLTVNGVEASYGEVTGYQQRADKGKNGFDLWRLARYGKFILDRGVHLVPLLQIIYDQGVVYRMMVPARGVMVLAEVGLFTIPLYLNAIGNFQASLPVLEWYKMTMQQLLTDPRENRRRSWNTGDASKIKKFLG